MLQNAQRTVRMGALSLGAVPSHLVPPSPVAGWNYTRQHVPAFGTVVALLRRRSIPTPAAIEFSGEMLETLLMTLVPRIAEPLVDDPLGNEELRQRVVLHLTSCRTELCGIEAIVDDGTVTLRGELPTFFLRQLAIERTRRVAGVRLLVDRIEVLPLPDGIRRTPK